MQTQTTSSDRRDDGADRATRLQPRAAEALELCADAWRALHSIGRLIALAAAGAAMACALLADVPTATALTLAACVPAVIVDVHVRRLPDVLVGAAALVGIVAAVVSGMFGGVFGGVVADRVPLGDVAIGAVVAGGPMFVLHVASPRSMGFGDVKLGLVLGGALGAVDWQLALSGLALAAGLTAVVALLRRRDTIAFGPGLLAGALLAVACQSVLLPDAEAAAAEDTPTHPTAVTRGAAIGR